jgi:hypothetical protein
MRRKISYLPRPNTNAGAPDEDRSGGFKHGGCLVPYADEDLERLETAWIEQAPVPA